MEPFRTEIRVRYAETDQMGVVHHSRYALYFEVGRTDYMRQHDLSYADMEAAGLALPVVEMTTRFFQPARFDELLLVETRLVEVGGVRVRFEYRVLRHADEQLLCSGSTTLASVNPEGRPTRIQSPWRQRIEAALSAPPPAPP